MSSPSVPPVPANYPFDSLDEDSATYSFQELLNALNDARDIIITIPTEQVQELQDGLQARKSKNNYAARQKGVEPPAERLAFIVYPAREPSGNVIEGQTCVRVSLKARKSVDILKMEFPSSEL